MGTYRYTWKNLLTFEPKQDLPYCIKAKGACPPEDVGGIWGYYDFLEALNDSKHPEHEGFREWIGGDFDPDACDIDKINRLLAEYCWECHQSR